VEDAKFLYGETMALREMDFGDKVQWRDVALVVETWLPATVIKVNLPLCTSTTL
jgi:hypothetical protein